VAAAKGVKRPDPHGALLGLKDFEAQLVVHKDKPGKE